jgi:hypothetical protein
MGYRIGYGLQEQGREYRDRLRIESKWCGVLGTDYRVQHTGYRTHGTGAEGTGYRVWCTGFRVQGKKGNRVQGAWFRVQKQDTGYTVQVTGYKAQDTEFGVNNKGDRIEQATGYRVQGSGYIV